MSANFSIIENIRNLSPQQRLEAITEVLDSNDHHINALKGEGSLPLNVADGMIENVIGRFELPLGIATNFQVNSKDYLIPMAVEEPSVVAAASHMAKLARMNGGFQAYSDRPIMRGQIQLMDLKDLNAAKRKILEHKDELIFAANEKDKTLVDLGGGCEGLEVYLFEKTPAGPMLIVHLLVDVCDAMGANTVNTMAEHIAPLIEKLTDGKVRLRILSNLADKRLVTASVKLNASQFTTKNYSGNEVIKGIFEAASFATVDPYRAATHNKGIMNGIDSVVIATGNDFRSVEAGIHAYASRNGNYRGLTNAYIENGNFHFDLKIPISIGTVGGLTKLHPLVNWAHNLLGNPNATELMQIIASVGLAQNFAALKSLITSGIQKGHMKMHLLNILNQLGADKFEKREAVEFFKTNYVTYNNVREFLNKK